MNEIVDGVPAYSKMRFKYNANEIITQGLFRVDLPSGADIGTPGSLSTLQVYQPTAGDDAVMTFHVGSDYAVHFGLDGGNNDLYVGGWSKGDGVKHKIWHEGSHGADSGLDADLLDGQHGSYYRDASNLDTGTISDARLPDTIGRTTFNAGVMITGLLADTMTSNLLIEGGDPTIALSDTGSHDDFYIHVNSNNFYILRDDDGVTGQWDGPHPLQLEADTNDGYMFGRRLIDNGNFSVNGSGYFQTNLRVDGDITMKTGLILTLDCVYQ